MATTGRIAGIAVLGALFGVGPLIAAVTPLTPTQFGAAEFERLGQWDKACEAYLRLLAEDRQQSEIRERLALCIRHWHQSRRLGDPLYRARLNTLPLSQALSLYSESITTLQSHYFDPARITAARLYRHGIDEIRFAFADPAFRREYLAGVEPAAIAALRERLEDWFVRPIADLTEARQAVRDLAWEAQRLTGLNPSLIVLECACGSCNGLDEFSFFVAPGQTFADLRSLSDDLAPYGLSLSGRDDHTVIERVAPGSWAASEGFRPGDRITHVGKASLDRLTLEAALELIRGERPAITELTIWPVAATEPRTIALPAFVPSILEATMERDGVGYVRLGSFQKTTPPELESAILRLRSEGMRALILDLRGNPGGSFPAAVQIAERFLPQGVIVSTFGQLRGLTRTFSAQNPPALSFPLVVLIDEETASAAEVLAGALKDHGRATLVGTATYGKDSIQRLLRLSEGGAMRLTLARFLLPGGKSFAGVGIQPHIAEPRREPMRDYQFETGLEQAVRMLAMR